MANKIGRNDPCPCGSGKKLKHCHRDPAAAPRPRGPWGRIKTAVIGADRVIVLPGELITIPATQHLHDFLIDFAKNTLGIEWGKAELGKPPLYRHPVMQWFAAAGEQMKSARADIPDGELIATVPNGGSAAFHRFAFDLFTVKNAGLLSPQLLHRLGQTHGFAGAAYELYVYSLFVRAGFAIDPEDESSRASKHCEFEAVYLTQGSRYSVEAKGRQRLGWLGEPGDPLPIEAIQLDFGHLLNQALKKPAAYPRIVFIDVNVPPDSGESAIPPWVEHLRATIERKERQLVNGRPLPPCHLFITNRPYHYAANSATPNTRVIGCGFNISGYRDLTYEEQCTRYPAIGALVECSHASASGVPDNFPGIASA